MQYKRWDVEMMLLLLLRLDDLEGNGGLVLGRGGLLFHDLGVGCVY